jgi:hypothetical protein
MKKLLMPQEQAGELKETPSFVVLGYRMEFLNKNADQIIHKVEVKNINFQDLTRHLRRGEPVLITPKLQEEHLVRARKQHRETWYIPHI